LNAGGAIVGIEIEVEKTLGKSKLGQNRELRDRASAIEALRKHGEQGKKPRRKGKTEY
jgi:predicted FMN-binding regulatory protein PaiB